MPRARAWAAALFLGLSGCGGVRVADQPLPRGLAWPAGAPRVRLVRVIEFQRGRAGLLKLAGGEGDERLFVRPYGVAWQADDLLVADPEARRVTRITADGRVSRSPASELGSPVFVAACAQGVVTSDPEGGRVALLHHDLRRARWLHEGLARPTGVACAGEKVFVVETAAHRLIALSPASDPEFYGGRGSELGHFNYPSAVAVDGDSLLIGDTLNFRVQRLDAATGAATGSFGGLGDAAGEMPRIKGVAVDARGHIWVSDAHTDRVSLYDREGQLLLSLGGGGGRAPGQFSFPAGIAAHPDGRVAVADSMNRRVAIFRLVDTDGGTP